MDDETEATESNTSGSCTYGPRIVTSDDSSDDSVEIYREKIRGLQELIGNLNKKLQSEKIQRNGIDTITAILQEEREHNAKLQEELEKCKQEVKELQQIPFGEKLQPAKELQSQTVQVSSTEYENLQKENMSLKSELRYLSVDPAKMDEIMKEIDSMKAQQTALVDELNQVKQENVNLKKIMAQSPDEKQREISKLIGQLEEAKQQGKVNDLLCCSLSDQIKVLQQRLHHTDNICQQLLCELQQKMGVTDPITGTNLLPSSLGQPSSLNSPLVQMKMNSSGTEGISLQDKMKLEAQLKELFEVNQKWKEYHDKREMEFQQLKQQLKDTEKKLREDNSQLSEKQQEQIDRLVLQYKRQIDGLETDKEKLLDENRKLRVELNTAVLNNKKLEDQLKPLLELKQTAGSKGVSTSTNEEIQVLQWQVKTFSEDFEQEKRDRERAQQQVKDLERQISAYRTRLASMQRERQNLVHHQRALIQCDDAIDLDSVEMPEPSPPPLGLISRGVYQSDNGEDYDEVDMNNALLKQDKEEMTTDFVKCPECLTEFPKSNHSELLEHMNKCLK